METESFSTGDFITTIASNFDFENGAAEIQSKHIVENMRSDFSNVNNISGVGFRDNCNKAVVVKYFASPLPALTYFFLHSGVVGDIVYPMRTK